MTTAERIRLLRRHGLENAVIAAVLGVNCDAIADHIADPSIDVAIPGGGSAVDVTGLLPLDGSRAMTGPLKFGHTEIDSIWRGYAIAVESDTHDFGDFVVGNPSDSAYAEIYATSDPGTTSLFLQGAGDNYVAGQAGPAGSYLAVDNDTTLTRLSTAFGLELYLQPDALGIAIRDNSVDVNSYRWQVTPHGSLHWGDGTLAPDVRLERPSPGWLDLYAHGLEIFDANAALWTVVDDNWDNYGEYGAHGWDIEYPEGSASLHVGSGQAQFSMIDAYGGHFVNTRQANHYAAADDPTHVFWAWGLTADGGNQRWKFDYNGRLQWGPGSTGPDTHLRRAAAGVLEIEEHGGGLKLTSPDGSQTKTLRLSNAGALELV